MRAAVVDALPSRAFAQVDLAEPEPAADEIVLEVEACGICGTDLHILDGASYRPRLPFVLGHEPVGRVVAAGAEAHVPLGARVAITLFTGCGRCALCAAGDERLCEDLVSITGVLARHGGFAERLAVRAAQAVRVPDALGPADAATLVDAGATAANAVRRARSTPGACVIVGGGPVGFLVAELLRAERRVLMVVEPQAARRAALHALGHAVAAGVADVAAADVVLDCSAAPEVPSFALDVLRPRGTLVVVGYGRTPPLDLAPLARKELCVLGVRSGDRADLERVLALAAAGAIRLPQIATFPLARIDDAFAALRAGTLPGKAVVVP
jgi:2-desacetyl-2-hydroxyethyl bacteriochlorophyllide A dehydrogenase